MLAREFCLCVFTYRICDLNHSIEGYMGARGTPVFSKPGHKEKNMPVVDIYSKRQKRLCGEVPDIYQYEAIPCKLRVQIIHIWRDAFGVGSTNFRAYSHIYNVLCREYGVLAIGRDEDSYEDCVCNHLLETQKVEEALDVIEVSFRYIDTSVRSHPQAFDSTIEVDDAIVELNQRFHEHRVGYQYESGQIIRVDSQYLHAEAVKPALTMLSDQMFEGANAEFLSAHEHYRAKKYKECLNDCLKAFESCLKAICDKQGWAYGGKDTADRLVAIVFKNKLIPDFMQSHFSELRKTLKAGVPTIRNELGGHGQGSQEVHVPGYIAAYALHLTASNILLLAKAEEELPPDIPF